MKRKTRKATLSSMVKSKTLVVEELTLLKLILYLEKTGAAKPKPLQHLLGGYHTFDSGITTDATLFPELLVPLNSTYHMTLAPSLLFIRH